MAGDDPGPEYPRDDDASRPLWLDIVNAGTHRPADPDFRDMLRDRERVHAEVMEERRLKEQGAILWREREEKQARRKIGWTVIGAVATALLTAATQQFWSAWASWVWWLLTTVRTAP